MQLITIDLKSDGVGRFVSEETINIDIVKQFLEKEYDSLYILQDLHGNLYSNYLRCYIFWKIEPITTV